MRTFDPTRPDFSPYGFECTLWSPAKMARPNRHNEIELLLVRSGWLDMRVGGRDTRFAAGRLGAFWAAIPHQIFAFEGRDQYFVATIPLAWFMQAHMPASLVQQILRGRVVSETSAAGGALDAQLFQRWADDLADGRAQRQRIVLLEMEARLLRLADPSNLGPDTEGPDDLAGLGQGGLRKVEQMASFIARRFTEPLSITSIGAAVNLHPNYAMTLFHKAFGTTLLSYLTELRVSHARRLLATTDDKILDVALSSGFNSLSRFNTAFRRTVGTAPSEFRRRQRRSPG